MRRTTHPRRAEGGFRLSLFFRSRLTGAETSSERFCRRKCERARYGHRCQKIYPKKSEQLRDQLSESHRPDPICYVVSERDFCPAVKSIVTLPVMCDAGGTTTENWWKTLTCGWQWRQTFGVKTLANLIVDMVVKEDKGKIFASGYKNVIDIAVVG